MNTTRIGNLGEDMACDYLISKGYKIVDRNYKCKISEIDIIAYDSSGVLCFCEVKTRRNSEFGYGYESVNSAKIHQLHKGALSYISKRKLDCPVRFDVLEIYGRATAFGFVTDSINHIEDAF